MPNITADMLGLIVIEQMIAKDWANGTIVVGTADIAIGKSCSYYFVDDIDDQAIATTTVPGLRCFASSI